MGKYKKLFTNTFALTLGQFSSKILSFLLIPLYTSVLSTEEYGVYDLIVTTVTLLTPFLTLVVAEAVLRFCVDEEYKNFEVLTIGVLFVAIGCSILLFCRPLIVRVLALKNYFIWIFLFFLTMNLHTVLTQYLKGVGKVKQYSVLGVASTALSLTLNVLFLAVFRMGITGYLLAAVLSHGLIIAIIVVYNKLWTEVCNPLKIQPETYMNILRFSVPMIPNSVSWWISDSSDKYLLLYFTSASVVGIYSVAYKIPTLMTVVMTVFIAAFQLSIFDEFSKKNSMVFFNDVYKIIFTVMIIVASGLVFFSKYLAAFLYRNDFYDAWKVGCILIFAFVFNSLSSMIGTLYTASKKTSFLFISTSLAAAFNIVLNIVFIPKFGSYGAAFATLVSYVSVWLLRACDTQKRLGIVCINYRLLIMLILIIAEIVFQIFLENSTISFTMMSIIIILGVLEFTKTMLFNNLKNLLCKKRKNT